MVRKNHRMLKLAMKVPNNDPVITLQRYYLKYHTRIHNVRCGTMTSETSVYSCTLYAVLALWFAVIPRSHDEAREKENDCISDSY